MKPRTFELVAQHFRIGTIYATIILDLILFIPVINDLIVFLGLTLSLKAVIINIGSVIFFREIIISAILLGLFVGLALPIIIAIIGISFELSFKWRSLLSKRNESIAWLHLGLALLLGLSIIMTKAMELASGSAQMSNTLFSSFTLILYTWYIPGYFIAVLPIVIQIVLASLGANLKNIPNWLRSYIRKSYLADLPHRLYPTYGRHELNFNAAAIAPEIKAIKNYSEQIVKNYQKRIPGSKASSDYILKQYMEIKNLIVELFFSSSLNDSIRVELYPGTSRALEVLISRIDNPKTIVLLPYEHQSEKAVAEWVKITQGCEVKLVVFDADDYDLPWVEQIEKLEKKINGLQIEGNSNVVFIVSQVHFASGSIIKVDDIVELVKDIMKNKRNEKNLSFILDCAHSYGNIEGDIDLEAINYCLFSGHKWLLSPEPCGIVICLKGDRGGEGNEKSYDVWCNRIPTTTGSVRMIAGLRASLEMIKSDGYQYLKTRSLRLREAFEQRLHNGLTIVSSSEDRNSCISNMLAVRPRAGFNWLYNKKNQLEEYFDGQSVYVSVFDMSINNPDMPRKLWVRISFSYFLSDIEVKRLCNILGNAIQSNTL